MEYVISKRYDLVVDSFFYLDPVYGFEYRDDVFGFRSSSYGTRERERAFCSSWR